jgi:hypothetical protein
MTLEMTMKIANGPGELLRLMPLKGMEEIAEALTYPVMIYDSEEIEGMASEIDQSKTGAPAS